MSAEQLTAFWEAVEGDNSLQEKLNASTDREIDTPIEVDAVIALAKDAGFTITAGDLLRADAQAILELNDEELKKVAGGCFLSANGLLGAHIRCSLTEMRVGAQLERRRQGLPYI